MERTKATNKGRMPLTDKENIARNLEADQWEKTAKSRETKRAINKIANKLGHNIESIMDVLELSQRKKLPAEMQELYTQIKELRK